MEKTLELKQVWIECKETQGSTDNHMISILLDWWTGRSNEVTNIITTIMESQLIDYIMNSKIKHNCHEFNSMTSVPIKIELKQEEVIFVKKIKWK